MTGLVEKLYITSDLTDNELRELINTNDIAVSELLRKRADEARQQSYQKKVFLRGLIEVSSYCRNNCLYCGIRRGNPEAERYRLSREDILKCCENGYELGFHPYHDITDKDYEGAVYFTKETQQMTVNDVDCPYETYKVCLTAKDDSSSSAYISFSKD